jgi:hypothetical protein
MAETTQFTIGADATCDDGVCGEVSRVVVDPVARAVTHLVVEPKHRRGFGRLVPVDLVDATGGEIRLRCTMAAFEELDAAEETQFLPGSSGMTGYDQEQAFSWPYYGMGGVTGMEIGMGLGAGNAWQPVVYDIVPAGEVVVRRGSRSMPPMATSAECRASSSTLVTAT